MTGIGVRCRRGDRSPVSFSLRGGRQDVAGVLDRWYGPAAQYFKVRAGDGAIYILRHDEEDDRWSLAAFRGTQVPEKPTEGIP